MKNFRNTVFCVSEIFLYKGDLGLRFKNSQVFISFVYGKINDIPPKTPLNKADELKNEFVCSLNS